MKIEFVIENHFSLTELSTRLLVASSITDVVTYYSNGAGRSHCRVLLIIIYAHAYSTKGS